MKRSSLFVLILSLALPLSINSVLAASLPLSQEQDPLQASQPTDPRVQIVKAYLGLSGVQTDRVARLLGTREQTVSPLLRTLNEQEQELARLLKTPSPDPAAVGSVVILIRGTRAHIDAAQDTFRRGFGDILTNDQKRKLGELEAFIEDQRAAPAFLSLGLIEVNLAPEPQRTIQKALGPGIR